MNKHAISKELQSKLDVLRAERRAQVANPIWKLEAFILVNATVDSDRLYRQFLVQAIDDMGGYMENVFIDYRVIDDGTGSTFVLDGKPIGSSSGLTEGAGGFALATAPLRTGKTPGSFRVRATAPNNADPATVFADFTLTVSSQVPTTIRIVTRGEVSIPIGDVVPVEANVELLDEEGKPITHGRIQIQVHDPNNTGTLYTVGGTVTERLQISLASGPEGTPLPGALLVGANASGKDVYLRVDRVGQDPTNDIRYTTVPGARGAAR